MTPQALWRRRQLDASSQSSAWVSSNPPPYARNLVTSFKKKGRFKVTLYVSSRDRRRRLPPHSMRHRGSRRPYALSRPITRRHHPRRFPLDRRSAEPGINYGGKNVLTSHWLDAASCRCSRGVGHGICACSPGGLRCHYRWTTGNSVLAALPPSVNLDVAVSGLPETVGMYALHCAVPENPRSAPTQCDGGTGTLVYLPAGSVRDGSAQVPLKMNAEFYGVNPNPQGAPDTPELVDCRVDTGNPRSTTCAVYTGSRPRVKQPGLLAGVPHAVQRVDEEPSQRHHQGHGG